MNITIMMSVGCQNLGDELILKNEIKLLRQKYGLNTNFKVFSYDLENIFYIDEKVYYVEYFPIGIKNIKNIFRNIKNFLNFIKTIKWSDKIIIGGGGIFFDNETGNFSNPLNLWLFRTQIIKLFKKEIVFFGVSIDIKYESNLSKIKKIFSTSKEIYVRDNQTQELLKNLGLNSEVILDPVFYDNEKVGLENYKKNFLVKKIDPKFFSLKDLENLIFDKKIVGIAFRKGYFQDDNKIVNDIIDFILSKGGEVLLLPHSFHKIDEFANDFIFLSNFLKKGVKITKSMEETYLAYKENKIDFCLSMRLHSMILSQIYSIPFISLNYSKKTWFI